MSRPPRTIIVDGWKYRRVGPNGRPPKQPVVVDGANLWRCSYCGTPKPASEFHRDRHARNGLKSWCIDCCRGK